MPIKAHPSSKPRGKPAGNQSSGRRMDRKCGSRRRRSLSGPSELISDEFGSSDTSESYVLDSIVNNKSRKRSVYSDDSSRSGSRPHRSRDNCNMNSESDEFLKEYERIINRMYSPSGDRNGRAKKQAKATGDRQTRESRSMHLCNYHREVQQQPSRDGRGDRADRWFDRSGGFAGGGGDGRCGAGSGDRANNGGEIRSRCITNIHFDGKGRRAAGSATHLTGAERRVACGNGFDTRGRDGGGKASGGGRGDIQKSGSPSGSFTKSGEPSSQIAYQAKMSPLTTDSSSEKTPSPKRRQDCRQAARLAVYDANTSNRQQTIRRRIPSRNSPVSPSPSQSPAVPSPHPARRRYGGQYGEQYFKDTGPRWRHDRHSNECDIYKQSHRQCCRPSPNSCRKTCPDFEQSCRDNGQPRVQERQPSIYTGNHVESDILARSKSNSLRRLYSLRSQHYDENEYCPGKGKHGCPVLSWDDSECDDGPRRPRRLQPQQQFKHEVKQAHVYQQRQQKTPERTPPGVYEIKSRKGGSPSIYHHGDTQKHQRHVRNCSSRRDCQSRSSWQASSADSDGFDDAASFKEVSTRVSRQDFTAALPSSSARRPPQASTPKETFEDINRAPSRRSLKMPTNDAAVAPRRHWCNGIGRMRETRSRRQTLFSCPYMSLSLQTKTYECDRCAGYLDYTNNMNSCHATPYHKETVRRKPSSLPGFGRGNEVQRRRDRAHRGREAENHPLDCWSQNERY